VRPVALVSACRQLRSGMAVAVSGPGHWRLTSPARCVRAHRTGVLVVTGEGQELSNAVMTVVGSPDPLLPSPVIPESLTGAASSRPRAMGHQADGRPGTIGWCLPASLREGAGRAVFVPFCQAYVPPPRSLPVPTSAGPSLSAALPSLDPAAWPATRSRPD